MAYSIVGIGTSWGGLAALTKLLSGLPGDFSVPVVVVQHRSSDSDRLLADLLQDTTDLTVSEVEDKDPLTPGTVLIAPANYHVLVDDGFLSLTLEEPVRFSRPSIDVMFSSAADMYGSATIGVVLTGANEDGARGLSDIVKRGGRALVQDPRTAEIAVMPSAAVKAVPSAEVLPLEAMAPRLVQLSRERAKAGVRQTV
ncbi:MAG TPA: chemotaxis protein CheB [Gemmatimonadaceae bacterium]|nr:chemotaxis protein CheB [Gemmatimonadaceae bacterium]